MTNRVEVFDNELEQVTGGALRWKGGVVYPKDNPNARYTFTDFNACTDYIKNNWDGSKHTEETLIMLEAAGLVKKE